MANVGLLGKLPATPENVLLEFKDYAKISAMPAPPDDFGHEHTVRDWGMLGNDTAGCCYCSGTYHQFMMWDAEGKRRFSASTGTVIKYYQELTRIFNGQAYDPNAASFWTGENPTDTGINVSRALPLLQKVGCPDDQGNRHKIGAYVKLRLNIDELKYASYYFDGVGLGIQVPAQWQEAFQQDHLVWDAVDNPEIIGGHYICDVAWRNSNPVIISWGQPVELTISGFEQATDEVYAYLAPEKLVNGVDLEGLDLAKLAGDLRDLRSIR